MQTESRLTTVESPGRENRPLADGAIAHLGPDAELAGLLHLRRKELLKLRWRGLHAEADRLEEQYRDDAEMFLTFLEPGAWRLTGS
jgi:hypothetical protein